jgi:hypothetical protein
MDTGALKRFAQEARRTLREQVTSKLGLVLAKDSLTRREAPKAVQQLEGEIHRTSREQVIERAAYTWFNRFTALRFMDANGYTSVRVATPADGQTRPEILAEAMAGVIGDEVPAATAEKVRALLEGRAPSHDPQGEAYRLLVVAACNHWHRAMPFIFEPIADYTELLMPEDLLSQGSILAKLRAVMTADECQDVEIIGWLYQFYISQKKDEVFAGLKKNKKISPENIPAATQLFTPHWIVRYLVENSLGRLWMLNRPGSRLRERMDYYIAPEEPDADFLRISSPEEIKVSDPACGSGHILTYAFDLLYAIYDEEGYDAAEIPSLILTHNLYGIEIDERAGALAAFALTMKAATRRKRFLWRGAQPNVCVLAPVKFEARELDEYVAAVGRDLFTAPLKETLTQFEEADNFGSLIRPALTDVAEVRQILDAKGVGHNLFLRDVHARVQQVLWMAEYLAPRYHVVVTNPPYMGGGGMNGRLGSWLKVNYPNTKYDLMTAFMERAAILTKVGGHWGMINLPSWMFLSSFEVLRRSILENQALRSLLHLGRGIFGSDFGSVAFVITRRSPPNETKGVYRRLFEKHVQVRKPEVIDGLFLDVTYNRYLVKQSDLRRIPGNPIAYSASAAVIDAFSAGLFSDDFISDGYLKTGNNAKYIRYYWEVGSDDRSPLGPWRDHPKGGDFRRWSGNRESVVLWTDEAIEHYQKNFIARILDKKYWDKVGISWSAVTSGEPSFRILRSNDIASNAALCIFPNEGIDLYGALAYLNSRVGRHLLSFRTQTLNFLVGDVLSIPKLTIGAPQIGLNSRACVELSDVDWDSYEISWDFTTLPLLAPEHRAETLEQTYARLRAHWREQTLEMQRLEEENNRIFMDAYGLQDELTPEVPLEEITLTCNPAYRYGGKRSGAELEELLEADTVRELVSYAVGCMLGRFSLDAPGLILANRGEGIEEYLAKVPNPSFQPDADNVLPVLEGEWFADDIAARFRSFLRVAFGEAHFQENLAFVEAALCKDIRKYLVRDFFNDHVKRYKKRPIYWLFSSPRGTFNALVYMYRYRPDTVSVVLNSYLREFRSKLEGHRREQEALSISGAASAAQKAKALKEIEATARQIEEIDAWERDVLFPLASQKIKIDLDDGVKANYPKFGAGLKPIKGLNDAED